MRPFVQLVLSVSKSECVRGDVGMILGISLPSYRLCFKFLLQHSRRSIPFGADIRVCVCVYNQISSGTVERPFSPEQE